MRIHPGEQTALRDVLCDRNTFKILCKTLFHKTIFADGYAVERQTAAYYTGRSLYRKVIKQTVGLSGGGDQDRD